MWDDVQQIPPLLGVLPFSTGSKVTLSVWNEGKRDLVREWHGFVKHAEAWAAMHADEALLFSEGNSYLGPASMRWGCISAHVARVRLLKALWGTCISVCFPLKLAYHAD